MKIYISKYSGQGSFTRISTSFRDDFYAYIETDKATEIIDELKVRSECINHFSRDNEYYLDCLEDTAVNFIREIAWSNFREQGLVELNKSGQ